MPRISEIIELARGMKASDIHISQGLPMMFRINGHLGEAPVLLSEEDTKAVLWEILTEAQRKKFEEGHDLDFAWQTPDQNRQRVNVFQQKGQIAATIRLLNDQIPTMDQLGLPKVLSSLLDEPRGLILVTGPTGSGKSTTLAAMIDYINSSRAEHILTIEDPIEYVYQQKLSLIHQREVGKDVESFAKALRSALREDPDIILVGEMRDYETIAAALTASETGHLVMGTLHTTGASQTIDRIIDACPSESQGQIRIQLTGVLKAVVTQCLLPVKEGNGRVVATEILLGTNASLNMIRENKCHQLNTVMQSSINLGMHTLNWNLAQLVQSGKITPQVALKYSNDRNDLEQYIGKY